MTLVLVFGLLCWGHYTRKQHLAGVLIPDQGLIRIVPPVDGTVVSVTVREGQTVRAGDTLFVLAADLPTLTGDVQADISQAQRDRALSLAQAASQALALAVDQQRGLDDRLSGLQQELVQLRTQAGLQVQRLALAQQAQARLEALSQDHFVSSAQVQAKTEEVLGLQADQAALMRQQQALEREASGLQAQRRELPLQAANRQGEIERERAAMVEAAARSTAQAAGRRLVVRAPMDGVASAVMVRSGQPVVAGGSLASLTPLGSHLQALLYAPSSALGFLQVAQVVQLRLQAFPYQKFGLQPGRVVEIAQAPVQPSDMADLPVAAASAPEPMYRVTVALDRDAVMAGGQRRALMAGMQLDADVLLERRRLIAWLFEPLLGLAQRL
jgi:membrane fusion protein